MSGPVSGPKLCLKPTAWCQYTPPHVGSPCGTGGTSDSPPSRWCGLWKNHDGSCDQSLTAPSPSCRIPDATHRESETVNHPAHYNAHPSGVECITVTEHMTFNVGNAVKYLWRAGHKGSTVEDLKKAAWYVQREIERLEKK